jgi:hypothetical protein
MLKRTIFYFTLITISLISSEAFTEEGMSARVSRQVYRESATIKALSDVCPSIRAIQRGEIWKNVASTHIPRSDPRRYSTSFITLRSTSAPSLRCIKVYDSEGNQVHALGRYAPSGALYSSRSYGGHGCGDRKSARKVAADAQASGGSTKVYLKVRSNQCIEIGTPNTCYNSAAC